MAIIPLNCTGGRIIDPGKALGEKDLNELTVSHIRSYLLWLLKAQGYSESKVHTTINALKFYSEQVLLRARFFIEVPRPKKAFKITVGPFTHIRDQNSPILLL